MEFEQLSIPDVVLIKPNIFEDERGHFFESYHSQKIYQSITQINSTDWPPNHETFFQENIAFNKGKNVVRGLHFQKTQAQGKLVRVVSGSVLDVVVDNRRGSSTYGEWLSVELNDENNYSLWIPPRLAHGYRTLSKKSTMVYKCTNLYNPIDEGGIHPFDPHLNIDWGIDEEDALLSEKDTQWDLFQQQEGI